MPRAPLMSIEPATIETATGQTKDLLQSARTRLGFVPNMYGYMGKLPGVLAGYMSTYDAFRSTAGFTPAEQETVFLTISRLNGCTYCMAAHSMLADKMSGVAPDALAALRNGDPQPDPKLNALVTFVTEMVEHRGNPGKEAIDAFLAAGYGEEHVMGVILAIACKTFSNYVNHIAGTPVDEAFAAYKVD